MNKREPVLTAGSVTGAVLAVLTLIGLNLTAEQTSALTQILAVVVPLVLPILTSWAARNKVTPTSDVTDHPVNRRR